MFVVREVVEVVVQEQDEERDEERRKDVTAEWRSDRRPTSCPG